MKYEDMTPELREAKRAYMRKYYEEHKERCKENVKKWQSEHRDVYNSLMREQKYSDLNANGYPKIRIRLRSKKVLYRSHSKIQGYEIHHCFGYEDPKKFIYIPKYLHTKIHRLLRDNKIQADSNHWNAIRDLVNSCEDYTYIRT